MLNWIHRKTQGLFKGHRSGRNPRAGASARRRLDAALARSIAPVVEHLETRQLMSVPNGPFAAQATAASATQTQVTWYDNSDDEQGFRVERRSPGGSFATVGTVGANVTSFTDTSVAPGTTYDYRLTAYNATGDSSNWDTNDVTTSGNATSAPTPTPTPTSTPTGNNNATGADTNLSVLRGDWWHIPNGPFALTAVALSGSQAQLIWYSNSSNESGFRIERSDNGGAFNTVARVPAGTNTWTDGSLSAGATYSYRLTAYNPTGDSSAAGPTSIVTLGAYQGSTTTTTSIASTLNVGGVSAAAGYFPVGVFYQPTYSFDTWKSRGINTLYGYDGTGGPTMQQWDAAAAQRGIKVIRQPSDNPAADVTESNFLAWLQPVDEPDLKGIDPASLQQDYNRLKAISPGTPVVTTYSGGYVLNWQGNINNATWQRYMNATDWAGSDLYPVTGWNIPNDLGAVGRTVDRLQSYNSSKREFAFIETSNQQLWWVPVERGPTADEVRGEIWDSVIHGATGVVYFPQQIGNGFQYDATPANVAQEMTTQDARLQQYGAALLSTENPGTTSINTNNGTLEAAWRTYGGKNYYFVLNLSGSSVNNASMQVGNVGWSTANVGGENRSLTVANGTMTDSFKPYEMHVYVV